MRSFQNEGALVGGDVSEYLLLWRNQNSLHQSDLAVFHDVRQWPASALLDHNEITDP